VPSWLKSGTVLLTVAIAMPVWATVVIVGVLRGQAPSTDLMAIPIGLLAAAGVTGGAGYLIDIRRKKDDGGEPPDAPA
jgi:hypothetical protein